jgi:type II secretory pathway pseudopilin PulG
MKNDQNGFSVIETLLVLVIISLIGFVGWYVWHAKQNTDKNLTPVSEVNLPVTSKRQTAAVKASPSATAITYFNLKEWDVRASYSGQDKFTYKMSADGNLATVISQSLATNEGCSSMGAGQIKRLVGTDSSTEDGNGGLTVNAKAEQNPTLYTHLGNYYYQFVHDQASCSNTVTIDEQNQANNEVKALVERLQSTPN